MHRYGVEEGATRHVHLYLAIASIAAAFGLRVAFEWANFEPPWWLDTPAVMGFYGFFYQVFDKWLWRTWLIRTVRLSIVPNLGGRWSGTVQSSYDELSKEVDAYVAINQTWTHILIRLRTATSQSTSCVAAIEVLSHGDAVLTYAYSSVPKPGAVATMHSHSGTARLELHTENGRHTLSGDYYTGRDRSSHGAIRLTRAVR
jgi:hypothetical protein